jgi:hypothetical protein
MIVATNDKSEIMTCTGLIFTTTESDLVYLDDSFSPDYSAVAVFYIW